MFFGRWVVPGLMLGVWLTLELEDFFLPRHNHFESYGLWRLCTSPSIVCWGIILQLSTVCDSVTHRVPPPPHPPIHHWSYALLDWGLRCLIFWSKLVYTESLIQNLLCYKMPLSGHKVMNKEKTKRGWGTTENWQQSTDSSVVCFVFRMQ